MNSKIKIILSTAALTAALAGCAPAYADPMQAAAATWLATGDVGRDCPLADRATSPMRSDLELSEPEYRFTGDDGAERWQVRATGDGYDRRVVVREDASGQLCVVADTSPSA